MPLKVARIPVGPLQANCYLIHDPDTRRAIAVDPGDEGEELASYIQEQGLTLEAIWNTHAHFDHIGGNAALAAATGAPISVHELEAAWLTSGTLCGASLFGMPFTPSKADHTWKGGEELAGLGRSWRVYHTPGHSPGMCVIVCESEGLVAVGDLVFGGSIGRTDLPGGDAPAMVQSLRRFFDEYVKPGWALLPGHGDVTTAERELRSNPYVRMAREFGTLSEDI